MAVEDSKKQDTPPVVPEKELTTEPEPKAEDKGAEKETTVETESEPSKSSDDDMGHDTDAGRIRLDEMRTKPSYSDAVAGTGKRDASSKSKFSEMEKSFDPEGDRDMDNIDLEAVDAAMLGGLPSMEMFDAVPFQKPPARKSSLPPTAEEDEPGDDGRSTSGKATRSRSQDNYEKTSFSRRKDYENKDAEENQRLRRHVQDLYKKINKLDTEKQIAEEKAERAAARVAEMKHHLNSDMSEIELSTEALANERDKYRDENRALREQLNDAQSHIFSLQPYRKDLTPEEVGREYDALVEQVQDWVEKFMEKWTEDYEEGLEGVMTIARKRPSDATRFKRTLHQYPDLVHGSMFPETDEDIIASIIMRFLHDHIFQSILYGSIQNYVEVVSFIENHMQMSVEPKRDLFSVRTWTAEAYNALLSSPPFRSVRERRRKEMTVELATILKVFCKKDKFQWLCENIDDNCIWPAMKLYEKLQVSTHHFYLDINPYIMWGPGADLNTSPEFIDSLKNLDCKNILQSRRAFNLAKMDPEPSKKELYHHLLNVCTVVPALYMRQIGQKDAIKEPIVVRKQQMLVAYGPEDKRRKFVEKGDRPIIAHIYHAKNERSGGESWAPFRWG